MYRKNDKFILGNIKPVVDGDILWTVSYHVNAILKIDLKRKKLTDAYAIPDGNAGILQGHIEIQKKGSDIYVFPYFGKNIYCFNTENARFERIILEDNVHIAVSAVYKHYIFFLDANGKGIFRLNCENKGIDKKVFSRQEIELYELGKEDRFDFWYSCQKNDKLYVTLFSRNTVLVLDLLNNLYEFVTLSGDKNLGLGSIDRFQEGFIFSTVEEEIVIWEPDRINGMERLDFLKGNSRNHQRNYLKIFSDNKDLALIALWERKIIVKKGDEYIDMEFHYFPNADYPEYAMWQFLMVFGYGGKYYAQAVSNGQIYCIDIAKKEIRSIEISILEPIRKKLIKAIMHNNESVLEESNNISLDDYIEFLEVSSHGKLNLPNTEPHNMGGSIWHYLNKISKYTV